MIFVVVEPVFHHLGEFLQRCERHRRRFGPGRFLGLCVGPWVGSIVMMRMLARVPVVFVVMPLLMPLVTAH
jgi:hypothetical protein